MHADLKYVESLEKVIDELKSDKAEFSNMYDILLQECISDKVLRSASVLKRHRQEDESVDIASGIADEVLGASLLKHHCEELSESTETVVADLSSPTPANN
nr:hypothetical protein [Tanacetum cinerariifolium]